MTLNAAVIGLGVGEQHARAFATCPGSALRWVLDLEPERMTRVIEAIGQGAAATTIEAILADASTDIVSLATYDDQHAGQVVAALEAGKHVFCEKPLCRSLTELADIKRALKKSGRHLASNLVLRAAPVYAWLRDAIAAGELGEIYAFDGDYLYGRLHKITEGWRADVTDYSVTQGGGVHVIDLMLWLTGQRPASVTAVGSRVASAGTKFRYDDFAAATFTFESGMVGRITSNFGCVHRHQHVVRVFGTKATFLYDDRGPRLHRSRDPAVEPEILALSPLPASKGELIPQFVKSIAGGSKSAPLDAQHELDVIAACIAVDDAIRERQARTIEYP